MWSVAALGQVESPPLLLRFFGNKEFDKWQTLDLDLNKTFSFFFPLEIQPGNTRSNCRSGPKVTVKTQHQDDLETQVGFPAADFECD